LDHIVVPEDLTAIADADLKALAESVRAEAEAMGGDAATSDEALAMVEALVADYDRIAKELDSRSAQLQDRSDRIAAAMDHFVEPVADEVVETAIEAEVVMSTEVVVELSSEDDAPSEVVELATEVEVEEEVPAETILVEEVEKTETVELSLEVTVEDSNSLTGAEASSALTRRIPEGVTPLADSAPSGAILHASNAIPGLSEGTALDRMQLATAITKKRHGMNNASSGTYERVVLATAQSDLPNKVSGGAEENFSVFDTVRAEWAASTRERTSLVASGGNCAPIPPSYEFFRLAEPLNPVEQTLPSVEAPRGGIRFITPPDWTDALAGVRVTTEAEDAAGYGSASGLTAPKPCVHVDCPPIEECLVDAVSQCVEFGNLNYRVFPEQVAAFLEDLAVAFTSTKEIFYLDAIDATSTAVTAAPAYGATRGVTQTILAAAANYRRRQHMATNSVLTVMLPSWTVEFIKVDMVNDHALGLNFLNAGESEVTAWLASANLDVAWYYDSATGAGQAFNDIQGAGVINPFPTSIVGYMFAPGTYVRLDGGTLDVGIVRDSILNGTNDLQIFSEQWVQVCQVGLESLRLEITLCPDGTGPEAVTPLVCA